MWARLGIGGAVIGLVLGVVAGRFRCWCWFEVESSVLSFLASSRTWFGDLRPPPHGQVARLLLLLVGPSGWICWLLMAWAALGWLRQLATGVRARRSRVVCPELIFGQCSAVGGTD